jgi:nucleoid DNA-binding protein
MNKYIIDFLKQEGRVIIPNFGCLSLSEDGKVVFNTYIKFDDGKLSAYICEQTGNEAQDVINSISAWSSELQAQVNTGVDYELTGLGVFFKAGADDIDFRSGASASTSHTTSEKAKVEEVVEEKSASDENAVETEIEPAKEEEVADVPAQNETESEPEKPQTRKNTALAQASVEELKQTKNIYIPGDESSKEDKVKESSLEDVLGKTDLPQEKNPEVDKTADSTENSAAAATNQTEPAPVASEKISQEEQRTVVESAKHSEPEKTEAEEVTVKRKRGAFFYINIVLLLLIIGLSVFAYLYTDEISKWLGITTENVLPEVKEKEDSVEATTINQEENAAIDYEEDITEIVEETPPAPVDQTIIELTPAVASSGNFHVIVGTFSIKENAERLVQKIRDAGYDGKILRSTDVGHTVSFHSYNTKEEATNNIGKATEITGTSGYVLKQ